MSDLQKYLKISLVVDDGETTSIQTFYRTKDISWDMKKLWVRKAKWLWLGL